MNKDNYYERCQLLGALMWIVAAISGSIGIEWKNNSIIRFSAYMFILIGLYSIAFYLYFKRAPVLKGISPSKNWLISIMRAIQKNKIS